VKPTTRDIVNDFIHETYLETLDEHGIMGDLEHFSEICGQAISETIHDGKMIVELNRRLTEIRQSQTLATDREDSGWSDSRKPTVRRARRIVANKRLIISTISEISPTTAEQILCTLYPVSRVDSAAEPEVEAEVESTAIDEARRITVAEEQPQRDSQAQPLQSRPGLRWPPFLLGGGIVALVIYLVWAFAQVI
jgi:hypothetical protein